MNNTANTPVRFEGLPGRMMVMTCAIVVSIVAPLWSAALRLKSASKESLSMTTADAWTRLVNWQSPEDWGQLSYLLILLCAASAGYTAILWMYFKKARRVDPKCSLDTSLFPHLLPFTILVVVTNLAFGFFSFMEDAAHGHCADNVLCYGISPLQMFPNVFIPSGAILYACWGSFFYNVYQMLQRIVNQDFPPSIWLSGAFRTSAAILASLMLFAMAFQMTRKPPEFKGGIWIWHQETMNIALLLSFSAGFFPMMTIRQVLRFVVRHVAARSDYLSHFSFTPLTSIDGITSEVQDRLQEAGIDSIQMLAYASVPVLKDPLRAALPYEDRIIADWIDQARLALYFPNEADMRQLKAIGIRAYSCLLRYQQYVKNPEQAPDWDAIGELKGSINARQFKNLILFGQFPQMDGALGETEKDRPAPCRTNSECSCQCDAVPGAAPALARTAREPAQAPV